MKEKLEQELINSIGIVKEYLTKGAAFAAQEAPLIVEEIVRFNLYYSGVWIVLAGISLFISLVFLVKAVIANEKRDSNATESWVAALLISCVPSFVLSIIAIAHFRDFIMCLTAPRLFMIEYLGKLL